MVAILSRPQCVKNYIFKITVITPSIQCITFPSYKAPPWRFSFQPALWTRSLTWLLGNTTSVYVMLSRLSTTCAPARESGTNCDVPSSLEPSCCMIIVCPGMPSNPAVVILWAVIIWPGKMALATLVGSSSAVSDSNAISSLPSVSCGSWRTTTLFSLDSFFTVIRFWRTRSPTRTRFSGGVPKPCCFSWCSFNLSYLKKKKDVDGI